MLSPECYEQLLSAAAAAAAATTTTRTMRAYNDNRNTRQLDSRKFQNRRRLPPSPVDDPSSVTALIPVTVIYITVCCFTSASQKTEKTWDAAK